MARILVVEDELGIADAVLYALRADGMSAEHCLRGEPALARLREEAFDVAILDIGLPDLDGFALCPGDHAAPTSRLTPQPRTRRLPFTMAVVLSLHPTAEDAT